MFGLFNKKKEIKAVDCIYKTESAKYQALLQALNGDHFIYLIYYFEDTRQQFLELETQKNELNNNVKSNYKLIQANTLLSKLSIEKGTFIFLEHHPSFAIEQKIKQHLFETLSIESITFYTSLEDEILIKFGSDRIRVLLEKMGFQEDEKIEHQMITDSLIRAQQRIDEQVQYPSDTRMRKDWFILNQFQ